MKTKTHRIEIPTPYMVGPVNMHLLLGDAAILVDAGPDSPESRELVKKKIGEAGVAMGDIDAILITHAHLDHFGMAAWLREESGAEIHAHEADRLFLEKFPQSHDRAVQHFRETAERHGLSMEIFERVAAHYSESLHLGQPVGIDRPFREGETLEFGAVQLEPVFTPGHTAGSTCLVERSTRRLFSGDTVLEKVTPVSFFRGKRKDIGLARFQESLSRIRELEIERVHPGHQRNFEGLDGILDRIERHIEIRMKRVVDALSADEDKSADEIARYAFGEPQEDVQRWLGFVETLGILEILADEGRAEEKLHYGKARFRLV